MVKMLVSPTIILALTIGPGRPVDAGGRHLSAMFPQTVRLSLRLAAASYPQDALVPVTVRMTNASRRPILLSSSCSSGVSGTLGAHVLDDRGQVVYPPALPAFPNSNCGVAIPTPLAPGGKVAQHILVILRGRRIEPLVWLAAHHNGGMAMFSVTGHPVTVRLLAARPPAVRLVTRHHLHLVIRPALPSERGGPMYMDATVCPGTAPAIFHEGGTLDWTPDTSQTRGGYRLAPSCPQPSSWQVVIGWPNESVVVVGYNRG